MSFSTVYFWPVLKPLKPSQNMRSGEAHRSIGRVTDSRLVSNFEILKTCNLEFLVILKILITGSVNLEVLILNSRLTKKQNSQMHYQEKYRFFGSASEKLQRSILTNILKLIFQANYLLKT